MNRVDFIQKAGRYVLLAFLALIGLMLGRKAAYGKNCSACPEIASCNKLVACTTAPTAKETINSGFNGTKK